MEEQKEPLIVSAIQPTGELHLGNWAGAIRNWLKLQDEYPGRCFFAIVDLHSMTIDYKPEQKQRQILDLAASLLALGLDPKKCVFWVQSHVQEITELGWIFNTVTPVSEMMKMTQYKDKAGQHDKNINMGLLDYPVLQAADILMYGGNAVPVGQDQVQHVETTRVIAKNFNRKFGETFPEPKAHLNETPKIMSLTEPTKKMSKSHGEKTYISLDDEPEVIKEKISHIPTEPSGIVSKEKLETEEYAGVASLFQLLELFGSTEELKSALAGEKVRYGDLKARVAEVISLHFKDYRETKKALMKNPKKVRKILETGAKQARKVAQKTMEDVRKKTGLR